MDLSAQQSAKSLASLTPSQISGIGKLVSQRGHYWLRIWININFPTYTKLNSPTSSLWLPSQCFPSQFCPLSTSDTGLYPFRTNSTLFSRQWEKGMSQSAKQHLKTRANMSVPPLTRGRHVLYVHLMPWDSRMREWIQSAKQTSEAGFINSILTWNCGW